MSLTGWELFVPEKGDAKALVQALLAVAPDPQHVRTQAGGTEFLVSPEAAEAYRKSLRPKRAARKVKEENENGD